MNKLATPQDLQAALSHLIARCAEPSPNRSVMASDLRALANQLEARTASDTLGYVLALTKDLVEEEARKMVNSGRLAQELASRLSENNLGLRDAKDVAEEILYRAINRIDVQVDVPRTMRILKSDSVG